MRCIRSGKVRRLASSMQSLKPKWRGPQTAFQRHRVLRPSIRHDVNTGPLKETAQSASHGENRLQKETSSSELNGPPESMVRPQMAEARSLIETQPDAAVVSDIGTSDLSPSPALGALSRSARLAVLVLVLLCATPLVTACFLQPASAGLGTHQQLGLPPCSMRFLLGIRCPACGMTTSWAHFVRGSWPASVQSNSAGFLLAVLNCCLVVAGMVAIYRGEKPSPAMQRRFAYLLVAAGGIAVLDWAARLAGYL